MHSRIFFSAFSYLGICVRLKSFITIFITLNIFLIYFPARAEKTYAFYFGGGGEPQEKKETMFLDDLKDFNQLLKNKSWSPIVLHNGGHPVDDAWIKQSMPKATSPFNKKELDKTLKDAEDKIQSGQIKPGDQMMIIITTHGLPNDGSEVTHQIAVNDGDVSVAKLQQVKELAEKKGVRLAIIDTSCYGSESLTLASDKTCVISMSDQTTSNSLDGHTFFEGLGAEKNLEDAFLEGRTKADISTAQPQISTETGRFLRNKLKALSRAAQDSRGLVVDGKVQDSCKYNQKNIDDLKALLTEINSGDDIKNDPQTSEWMKTLEVHRKKELEVYRLIEQVKKSDTELCYKMSEVYQKCRKMSELEVMLSAYEDDVAKKNDPDGISKYTVGSIKKLLESSQYQQYKAQVNKVELLAKETDSKKYEIAKIEKAIYNQQYKKFSTANKSENPCRKFKL